MLVIAHRGASAERPENTLPAFELAVAQGADMIETDLHSTRDGMIVLTHDADLAGLGGSGEIADAGFDQVRALDAGEGEQIPTLDETLDAFGSKIGFNLELKVGLRSSYAGMEAAALEAVERRGILGRTLFSCFDDDVLARLRDLSADARIGLLLSPRHPHRALERAQALGAEAINPFWTLASPELVEGAHAQGLAVYPFTVDSPGEMERFVQLGVDGLFTNHPLRLRGLLEGS